MLWRVLMKVLLLVFFHVVSESRSHAFQFRGESARLPFHHANAIQKGMDARKYNCQNDSTPRSLPLAFQRITRSLTWQRHARKVGTEMDVEDAIATTKREKDINTRTQDDTNATADGARSSISKSKSNSKSALPLVPSNVQKYIRDKGILRTIVNSLTRTIAAPAFYYDYPHCFPEFIRISEYPHWLSTMTRNFMYNTWNVTDPNYEYSTSTTSSKKDQDEVQAQAQVQVHFQKERYASQHPHQRADVMVNKNLQHCNNVPIMIFVHGGAWGSGFPTMYRLISSPFLQRGYRMIILGYRTYPDAMTMDDQIDDLNTAIEYFRKKYSYSSNNNDDGDGKNNSKMVLIGHSSGAHITMMAALRGCLPSNIINGIVCLSGVYDLEIVPKREFDNGLTGISPLGPLCNCEEFERERENKYEHGEHAGIEFAPLLLP